MSNRDIFDELMKSHRKAEAFRSQKTTNRFPNEFKVMVLKAIKSGIKVTEIHRATGVSLATLKSWTKNGVRPQPIEPEIVPLKVVDDRVCHEIVISLPSGIKLHIPPLVLDRSLLAWMVNAS